MSKIVYLEDIVKELSSELNIPEQEILEICKSSVKFSHTLMEDPGVVSIVYPNLGVLHFNVGTVIAKHKLGTLSPAHRPIVKSKLEIIKSEYTKNKKLIHRRRSLYSKFRKFFYPIKSVRVKTRRLEVLKKIELKQNKL